MYRYHIDWCKIATTQLNDVATLGSCYVSFFCGNGFSKFQGKWMKVLTTATLAALLRPFFVLLWKSLKTSTTLTSSSGRPCCSSPRSLFCSSSPWLCYVAFPLFSLYSHYTWVSVYIYIKTRVIIKYNRHLQMFAARQHRSEILYTGRTSFLHGFACSSQMFPIASFVLDYRTSRP
jgi:hypothetical protein